VSDKVLYSHCACHLPMVSKFITQSNLETMVKINHESVVRYQE
jgi:hypothetical protein